MKLFEEYKEIMTTPGPLRLGALIMLAAWGLMAIWGWFFVEPMVLQNSQMARNFVNTTTQLFPWLKNVKNLGEQAEKALFLQCVAYFLFAPIGFFDALAWESKHRQQRKEASFTYKGLRVIGVMICIALVLSVHLELKTPADELYRMNRLIFINSFSVALIAPLAGYVF